MPKRKRNPLEDNELITDPVQRKRDFVSGIIEREEKQISRALKVGKGFERQKLSRRSKNATSKGDDNLAKRIESEIEALKALDLHTVAVHHFRKALLKVKAVASSPAMPFGREAIQSISNDTATLNVSARLYSSNPVKAAITHAIEEVSRALGVDALKSQKSTPVSRTKTSKSPTLNSAEPSSDSHITDTHEGVAAHGRRFVGNGSTNHALPMLSENSEDTISGSEQDEFAELDHRIASSSELTGDEDDLDEKTPQNRALARRHVSTEISMSPSTSSSRSLSPPARLENGSKGSHKARVNQSTFLPSLTLGGYVSGSESGSDDDLDVNPIRKNRRGQRARQAIWEQKYGNRAKHLQSQKRKSKEGDRNHGWDPKKGAIDSGVNTSRKRRTRDTRQFTNANAIEVSSSRNLQSNDNRRQRKEANDRPVHPSWEAKKRAKDGQSQTAAFQGKKITFD